MATGGRGGRVESLRKHAYPARNATDPTTGLMEFQLGGLSRIDNSYGHLNLKYKGIVLIFNRVFIYEIYFMLHQSQNLNMSILFYEDSFVENIFFDYIIGEDKKNRYHTLCLGLR